MAISIEITAQGLSPKIGAQQIRRLKKHALRMIALSWHRQYSQGKFTVAAANKYKYRRRRSKNIRRGTISKKWRNRKDGPISGAPLVWTGRTQQLAKQRTLGGTSKVGYVSSPVSALNFKPPGFPKRQMRYEYSLVLPSEERTVARDGEKFIRRQFNSGKKNIQVVT